MTGKTSPPEQETEPPTDHVHAQGGPARLSWARLLNRVFDIDIEHCPNCGGALKIIAAPSTRSGQTFYETCQVFFYCLIFFMPPGVSPDGRCRPSDSSHRTVYDPATSRR